LASKRIEVSPDIYEKLLDARQEGESVTDVLRRLLDAVPHSVNGRKFLEDLKPFLGLWKNLPDSYFEIMQQDQAELREEFSRRFGES